MEAVKQSRESEQIVKVYFALADNLESMKKRSTTIKPGLPCFSCWCPYHEDKMRINCEFRTSGVKRIQSSTIAHHSQKKGYRVRQSLSHPKTIKNSVYTKPKTNKKTQD